MTLGDQSEALYGGEIRPIRRDRFGEIVDEAAVHDASLPAVTPEMQAERYYLSRRRAERIIPRLTASELDALEDTIRAERLRRRRR